MPRRRAGKVPIDVDAMQIDLLSLTGHKMYGPKGCGALFVRKRTALTPLIVGGGQERGLRSGTLNVPGIVGLGARVRDLPRARWRRKATRLARLRDRLLDGLRSSVAGVIVNGSLDAPAAEQPAREFDGVDGESLLIGIGDIAVSSGSACSSASAAPSHVLRAILGDQPCRRRRSDSASAAFTTDADIDYAIEQVRDGGRAPSGDWRRRS